MESMESMMTLSRSAWTVESIKLSLSVSCPYRVVQMALCCPLIIMFQRVIPIIIIVRNRELWQIM